MPDVKYCPVALRLARVSMLPRACRARCGGVLHQGAHVAFQVTSSGFLDELGTMNLTRARKPGSAVGATPGYRTDVVPCAYTARSPLRATSGCASVSSRWGRGGPYDDVRRDDCATQGTGSRVLLARRRLEGYCLDTFTLNQNQPFVSPTLAVTRQKASFSKDWPDVANSREWTLPELSIVENRRGTDGEGITQM